MFTGSVVGAKYAATVRAKTKPTTTLFIVCSFISLMIKYCFTQKSGTIVAPHSVSCANQVIRT